MGKSGEGREKTVSDRRDLQGATSPALGDTESVQCNQSTRRQMEDNSGLEKTANNLECIVLGDLNLDYFQWDNPGHNMRMIEKTKLDIDTGLCTAGQGGDQVLGWSGRQMTLKGSLVK